jgi:hypothetical protein
MKLTSKSVGLGDDVAKITAFTRIDLLFKLWTKVTGIPCGCQARRAYLNEKFPYAPYPALNMFERRLY